MSNFYKLALRHRVGNNKVVFFNRSYCLDNIRDCMVNDGDILKL